MKVSISRRIWKYPAVPFLFLLPLISQVPLSAQDKREDSLWFRKIANEILTNGQAYANLRVLCKDVGPRLSGSPQAAKAVEVTARMLKAAGADTVILQPCMVPAWVRGAKEVANVTLKNGRTMDLRVAALGMSVATPAAGLRAEVVECRNFDELEQRKNDVKGKIVFFNFPMNPTLIETFRAYGEAGAYRGSGPSRAARYGAVGVMIRSLASNLDDYPHTGTTRYADSLPRIPAVALSTNDAEKLSSWLESGEVKTAYFKTHCKQGPDVLSYNVIGEIRGSEFPDEVLTVGGHLDSWDLGEGAHDDGTGCVQTIEILRTFRALGIRPKRTIRFVMFMNEENGLRGGNKYAEEAGKESRKYIFAMESDSGGFTPRSFGITGSEEQVAKARLWLELFKPYGIGDIEAGGGGADIGPLRKLGTATCGYEPDSQRYFDVHHASSDVFEAVSPRELNLGAVVMTQMIFMVDKYGF